MKFTKSVLVTKLKATAVHLSLSGIVFIYLAYQIYYNWYPQPYFQIDGGWQGLRLIAAVDLVLGPLLTFLIFDLSKTRREIVFDLSIILIVQLGSLAYGIHAAYTQRPVAIVTFIDTTISATLEQYAGKLESTDQLRQYSDEKPPIIYATIPLDREIMDEVNRVKQEENVPEHAQMQLYRPHSEFSPALRDRQPVLLAQLGRGNSEPAYDSWLESNGKTRDEVMIERFYGRYGNAWLVFDLDGEYLGYFDIEWVDYSQDAAKE